MTRVTVYVRLTYVDDSGKAHDFSAAEEGVRLSDDPVQISASNLAYGLIEETWGAVVDD